MTEGERNEYKACVLCPRRCGVDRTAGKKGFCGMTDRLYVARAGLHLWEEPCISGAEGSGTVFFSGCSLGCVYCQNRQIALGRAGLEIDADRLLEIFFELAEKGANNINLVTADHFLPTVAVTIEKAKNEGFRLPFLLNTGSYVTVEALRLLDGLVDIYLPDFKYIRESVAKEYSHAEDYPECAKAAIGEMVRQLRSRAERECGSGDSHLYRFDQRGILQRGIIVRHLLLPGHVIDAKLIVKYLYDTYGDEIYISLLNQYTPGPGIPGRMSRLKRKVTETEYRSLVDYAAGLGLVNGFMQVGDTAEESFIPDFSSGEGVIKEKRDNV